jgi:hypothetical protein
MEVVEETPSRTIYSRVQAMKAKTKYGAMLNYGIHLPDCVKTADDLGNENGDTAWITAIQTEPDLLDKFKAFEDCGESTPEKA